MSKKSSWGEKLNVGLRGRWRDVYKYDDGKTIDMGWRPNQIQNTAAVVVAGLLRRTYEDGAHPGFGGLLYLAVGSGDVSWDITPPTLDPSDTTLQNEYFRKFINVGDTNFIDPIDPSPAPPVAYQTRKISVAVTFLPLEANGALREFGLFAGQATGAANSGLMVNWVRHPLINKDNTLTITRTIEIEILNPGDCP